MRGKKGICVYYTCSWQRFKIVVFFEVLKIKLFGRQSVGRRGGIIIVLGQRQVLRRRLGLGVLGGGRVGERGGYGILVVFLGKQIRCFSFILFQEEFRGDNLCFFFRNFWKDFCIGLFLKVEFFFREKCIGDVGIGIVGLL